MVYYTVINHVPVLKAAAWKLNVYRSVQMAEIQLEMQTVEETAALFGQGDEHLHLLQEAFGVTCVLRGTAAKISGEEEAVQMASACIAAMQKLQAAGTPLDEQTVRYCIGLAKGGTANRVEELSADVMIITAKGRPVRPKTLGQKEYINAIAKNSITFGVGPAGTGKTYLAVAMAVKAFKAKEVSRIVLTRPAVEAGESLGFLPGDLQNKVDPYLRPLYDGLFDMLGQEAHQRLLEKGSIEVAPLAYMRGRTLDDSFIILDEAQNTTVEQMKMFLTRMGASSKVVVTGDITQIDLPSGKRSGLVDAIQVLKNIDDIAMVRFSDKDVVRHKLVQEIVKAYEKAGQRQSPAGQQKSRYSVPAKTFRGKK